MKNADIYAKLIVASIKAKMEYKVAFLFMLVALIFFYLGQIGVVLVTLSRFNTINGWTIGEMAFLYGLLVFSQAIATLFFSSLTGFETHVIEGTFDRLLLRPLSPLGQIMANNFEIGSLAHFIIGVTALYYGSMLAGVEWSIANGLFFCCCDDRGCYDPWRNTNCCISGSFLDFKKSLTCAYFRVFIKRADLIPSFNLQPLGSVVFDYYFPDSLHKLLPQPPFFKPGSRRAAFSSDYSVYDPGGGSFGSFCGSFTVASRDQSLPECGQLE